MATGKSTWKHNKLLTARRNYFDLGGTVPGISAIDIVGKPGTPAARTIANTNFQKANTKFLNNTQSTSTSEGASGWVGFGANIASDLIDMTNNIIANDVKEAEKQFRSSIYSNELKGTPNIGVDDIISKYKSYSPLDYITKDDFEKIGTGQLVGNAFAKGSKGAMAGLGTGNPWMALVGGVVGSTASVIGDLGRNHKITSATNRLRTDTDTVNDFNNRLLSYEAEKASNSQLNKAQANYAAFGGPIGDWDGAIGYSFMNDWLNNKKEEAENKGDYNTLTRLNTFGGGGPVTEFYNKGKETPSMTPITDFYQRMKAEQAVRGGFSGGRTGGAGAGIDWLSESPEYTTEKDTLWIPIQQTFNDAFSGARERGDKTFEFNGKRYTTDLDTTGDKDHWSAGQQRTREALIPVERTKRKKKEDNKKALGGNLMTHGADWDTRLMYIGNGGSHEQNKYGGVPMGVDPEGTPNLVEEGETIWNNYVFSRRLKVPMSFKKKYKLGGKLSFAEASLKLGKESEERPNDPISQRGLDALMSDLAQTQEEVKAKRQQKEMGMFALGGEVNKFDGEGDSQIRRVGNTSNKTDETDYYKVWSSTSLKAIEQQLQAIQAMPDGPEKIQAIKNWVSTANAHQKLASRYDKYLIDGWKGKAYKGVGKDLQKSWVDNGFNIEDNDGNLLIDSYLSSPSGGDVDNNYGKRTSLMNLGFGTQQWDPKFANHPSINLPMSTVLNLMSELGIELDEPVDDYQLFKYTTPEVVTRTQGEDPLAILDEIDMGNGLTARDVYEGREVPQGKPSAEQVVKQAKEDGYIFKENGQWRRWTPADGSDPRISLMNRNYSQVNQLQNNTGGFDYYFDLDKEVPEGKFQDWLRYAPAVGFGIGALVSGLSKPDYRNADAILEAARSAGSYQPVSFNPIGNYLAYKPIDREFYINQMNAQSGATRRAALQNSGLNRGTGMAALLAADNNYLTSLGKFAREAEEYNLAQRKDVEDFNRKTNMFNSEGIFQADAANQKAQMASGDNYLKGAMAAANLKQTISDQKDAAFSANFSGLFQSLGDIGREEYDYKMLNPLIQREVFGRGTAGIYGRGYSAANGGKLKKVRRKGFTI